MSTTAKAVFPTKKIKQAVGEILPKGQPFEVRVADSGIGGRKIVRIVTLAWKSLRGWERILKLLKGMEGQLSEAEDDRILRYSVLTPREYQELVIDHAAPSVSYVKAARSKKHAVRRKPARKAKRALAK